jgi:hypothetical protein
MKSSVTKAFRKKLMTSLHQFKSKLLKLMNFGVQILTIIVFSSNESVNANQSTPLVVSLDYRVLGLLEDDHIYWFWIGAHAKYDELLQRL